VHVGATPAIPFLLRVSPDRAKNGFRDTRCPERSGLGRSPCREQSRRGVSRLGFSTPDPAYLRRLSSIERPFPIERGSRSSRSPGGLECSSGPQSCSLKQSFAKAVEAHAASKTLAKVTSQRSSRSFRASMNPCGIPPRWPVGAELPQGHAQARPERRLFRWQAPRSRKAGGVDALRWKRAHMSGIWCGFGRPLPLFERVPEVCPADPSDSRQSCGGSPPSARKRPGAEPTEAGRAPSMARPSEAG
jgi:hypothetical protein